MSSMFYFASDFPLREQPNPHYKMMSVNEALAAGMKGIPAFMLKDGYDRDEPDVLLWSDRTIVIDTNTKTIDDGGLDDDFAILAVEKPLELHTKKKHCAYLELMQYTTGRANRIIEYLKDHLQTADEIELWHIWLDGESTHRICKAHVNIDTLTADDIKELEEAEVWKRPTTHYCYVLT